MGEPRFQPVRIFKEAYPQWERYDLFALKPHGSDDYDIWYNQLRVGYVMMLTDGEPETVCLSDPGTEND